MQHARLQERQGAAPQTEFLSVFDRLVVPGGKEMLFQVLGTHLGAVKGFVFADAVHDPRQTAGMVHFRMVADHQVDFPRVHDLGDVVQQLVRKFPFDRVDQGDLFIHHQKSVVGRSLVGAVAMKIPDVPVFYADVVDSFRNFDGSHGTPSKGGG